MGSLAQKIEEIYSPYVSTQVRDALVLEAKKIEEERDTFLTILTLQQTVKELETRIDDLAPEGDLEQRIRDKIAEIEATVPFAPGEGYATGYRDGVNDVLADIADVIDAVV